MRPHQIQTSVPRLTTIVDSFNGMLVMAIRSEEDEEVTRQAVVHFGQDQGAELILTLARAFNESFPDAMCDVSVRLLEGDE